MTNGICAVCDKEKPTVDMTDGRTNWPVCSDCREMVVMMFVLHGRLKTAVSEARQAMTGKITVVDPEEVTGHGRY